MADRTVTVKSSGGDYASRNAALAGESIDLVTNTRILTIDCYNFSDTTRASTGSGYTTNASYYIKITSPESDRHAGIWSDSKARLVCSGGDVFFIDEEYTVIEYQQIHDTDTSAFFRGCVVATRNNCTIRYCLLRGPGAYGGKLGIWIGDNAPTGVAVYRNIIYDHGAGQTSDLSAGITGDANSATNLIYQNTIFNCRYGIHCGDNTYAYTLKQNYLGGNSTADFYYTGACTTSKNVSSDATSPDGASYQGKNSYSNYFIDYANRDFHLKSTDTVLKDAGDNLGSPYDIDIDGVAVSGTWDIGADEYVSGVIVGSTCWGHVTGVTQDNTRTFTGNWTGTGTIENTGDTERIRLAAGEYMQSEVVNTGAVSDTISLNSYAAGGTVTVKYRTGASQAACEAAGWTTGASFTSTGYAQIRLEVEA